MLKYIVKLDGVNIQDQCQQSRRDRLVELVAVEIFFHP